MIEVENIKNQFGANHANGHVCVTVYCADMADLMVTTLNRYTSTHKQGSLDWWFHDSGSVECYQCVSGTVADLFDWLAHVLMMADKWSPERHEVAGSYREMARLIGDSLLRHWLAYTVLSADMGHLDWPGSAFLVEPDELLAEMAEDGDLNGAAWLVNDETYTPHTWELVRRWAPDDSGRAHVAGLPFPQSAYEHADQFDNGTVPTCGEDYIGHEGAAMSAPAAYVEISRRMGLTA